MRPEIYIGKGLSFRRYRSPFLSLPLFLPLPPSSSLFLSRPGVSNDKFARGVYCAPSMNITIASVTIL